MENQNMTTAVVRVGLKLLLFETSVIHFTVSETLYFVLWIYISQRDETLGGDN